MSEGSNGNGHGRIELLGQSKKKGGNKESPVTREQAMRDAQDIAIKVIEWHMQQVPGLITGMINGALVAYGLVELTPTKKPEAEGPKLMCEHQECGGTAEVPVVCTHPELVTGPASAEDSEAAP